jgi:hypothetical protein
MTLVSRFGSSPGFSARSEANFRTKSDTSKPMILVSLLNSKFAKVLLNNRANFGFGTLGYLSGT